MDSRSDRDLDLVLLGATGFVGRLTTQHLAHHAPGGLRLALAGRSPERLERLRNELGPAAAGWDLVTVDVTDDVALRALVARTRVVASTVGPYLRYGLPLVQACADLGTDYADLTGETLFARRSIDACHLRAQQTGARIVHSCGFDSVPSDLGVGLLAARVAAEGEGQLRKTVLHVRSMRGGISGGTIDSLRQQVIELKDHPGLRTVVSDPSCLVAGVDPPAATHTSVPSSTLRTRLQRRLPIRRAADGSWQTPFVMGGYNRQIVLRTNALSDYAYGPMFHYREVVDTGTGISGAVGAAALSALSGALTAGMWFRPTRTVLDRLLPDPGEGPSERTRRRGRFLVEVEAETTGGAVGRTRIGADLDPGYAGTAVMLGESALALALDDLPHRSGVLTPMSAMGEPLADRLRDQGFTIETELT
ncbi:MAG TPA: saccharopine dehydrogenase NADP-binding domain-containing protein [Propionibacteriaceae bacterium]|jgi:short subunit dehydrogenase-like uncharacterized protein